jgi:CRISPR-associated protein Cas1
LTFVGYRFRPDAWTVPDESIQRFQDGVRELLKTEKGLAGIPEIAKSHNDLIRGWRHYYFGNSPEMDRHLAALDGWRAAECARLLSALGLDPAAAGVWFEKLADHPTGSLPACAHEPAGSDVGADPPQPAEAAQDDWHTGRIAAHPRGARVFSTERHLRDGVIGAQQTPVVLEDGWLRIPTHGGFVSRSRSLLIVRRKAQTVFECAFDEISCVTIEAEGVVLSTTVIDECQRRAIPLAVCRTSGRPIARLVPARSPLESQLARRQLIAREGRTGTPFVQAILTAKLSNQRALLLYHSKYRRRGAQTRAGLAAAASAITGCIREIGAVTNLPMRRARRPLFLIEARATAHYWQAFGELLPGVLGFERRRHRDADDVLNKSLNYGYALLLNRVWIAVFRAGLAPSLGLLHTGRRRSAGLVFDLMEPFRQPVVDRTVLALAGRKAKLKLNEKGDLTIRTRGLLQRAFGKRLESASGPGGGSLLLQIQRRTNAFRRALADRQPYRPYRMTW